MRHGASFPRHRSRVGPAPRTFLFDHHGSIAPKPGISESPW
ncbi:hypothetical protein I553_4475 [Mycobacterium xenopi 4042]|uniref:Uncharacterized protein n=1 Tax=Mycobacterium xenopi 4042 TaxID=1299334 RepID=X8AGR9_MYCXE|nr:hypothetical protein I553_4475 [Mycobacterium xenopi 4042]